MSTTLTESRPATSLIIGFVGLTPVIQCEPWRRGDDQLGVQFVCQRCKHLWTHTKAEGQMVPHCDCWGTGGYVLMLDPGFAPSVAPDFRWADGAVGPRSAKGAENWRARLAAIEGIRGAFTTGALPPAVRTTAALDPSPPVPTVRRRAWLRFWRRSSGTRGPRPPSTSA